MGGKFMETAEMINQKIEATGFIKQNHYQVVEIQKGKVVMNAPLKEESLNPYQYAHGGFIFGLGDTAMGIAARTTGRNVVTLNASIQYLRPSVGKELRAEAEIIKEGKTICYARCNMYDENHKLTATMDASYYYID